MRQLRQLFLTDIPFIVPLSSFLIYLPLFLSFFFCLSSNSALAFGALSFPRINIPGAGLGHHHWISVVWCYFIIHICPFISRRFDDNRYWEAIRSALGEYLFSFSFMFCSGARDYFHDSLLYLISIYEKVVGLCSTTCMYHGRRLSDIHTRFIELFSFSSFWMTVFFFKIYLLSTGSCGSYVFCAVSMPIYQFIYSVLSHGLNCYTICHFYRLQRYLHGIVHYLGCLNGLFLLLFQGHS